MAFFLRGKLKKISRRGYDKQWFKYKRIHLLLEETARSGKRSIDIDDLAVQELDYLADEMLKIDSKPNSKGGITYTVSW